MGENTKIEWAHHTFNSWWGCVKISAACDHCYAESFAKRTGHDVWGPKAEYRYFSDRHWSEPAKWDERCRSAGIRERVFSASMSDWLDKAADPFVLARLLATIRLTKSLDWLLLTKRPQNFRARLEAAAALADRQTHDWIVSWLNGDAPANVWAGCTVENNEEERRRVPLLQQIPALVRFLSMEPLLEHVTLPDQLRGIHWVIAGGESGGGARPSAIKWIRYLRNYCAERHIAFLFKQWGEWAPTEPTTGGDFGGDMRAGRVVQVYGDGREPDGHFRSGDAYMRRVGKKLAGRLLDGRTWDQVPQEVAQ